MFGTILIPYDGSESARLALQYTDLLPHQNAILVRVEPPFQLLAPGPLEDFRPDWRVVRTEQIQEELAPVAERLRNQGRTAEIMVRFGDPAEEIIAAGADADLIVMTTQGRGTAGRALFGSVADRVSRYAPVPTLLIHTSTSPAVPSIARIVVPLDGSTRAEGALPMATTMATELDKPVHLVSVVRPDRIASGMPAPNQWQRPGAAAGSGGSQPQWHDVPTAMAYLDGIAEQLRASGLTVQADAPVGTATVTLLDQIRPDDLVVMTSHGRGGMERWLLGSVAEQLIRNAQAPVMIVRGAATDATT